MFFPRGPSLPIITLLQGSDRQCQLLRQSVRSSCCPIYPGSVSSLQADHHQDGVSFRSYKEIENKDGASFRSHKQTENEDGVSFQKSQQSDIVVITSLHLHTPNSRHDRVICATTWPQMILLTFSRLSAGALFASMSISVFSKCYATRSFLHHSWIGAVIEIEPTHDIHTCECPSWVIWHVITSNRIGAEAWSLTLTHGKPLMLTFTVCFSIDKCGEARFVTLTPLAVSLGPF